jgi:hypothetical protein
MALNHQSCKARFGQWSRASDFDLARQTRLLFVGPGASLQTLQLTAEVAQAAFPKGNRYLKMRVTFGYHLLSEIYAATAPPHLRTIPAIIHVETTMATDQDVTVVDDIHAGLDSRLIGATNLLPAPMANKVAIGNPAKAHAVNRRFRFSLISKIAWLVLSVPAVPRVKQTHAS